MTDSTTIRNSTPDDIPAIIPFVRRILEETGAQKAAYFDETFWRWEYQTPGLEALVAVAENADRVVGVFHYGPRDMLFDGQQTKMVLLQDLGVLPEYRRQGLFVEMAAHCDGQLDELQWDVTYALPNHRSFPGAIKYLHLKHIGNVPVYVRPLLPGKILAERLPGVVLWRGIGSLGMLSYNRLFPLPAAKDGLRLHPIERFDGSVNALSRDFVSRARIGCGRNARFLNWRFVDKPAIDYSVWGASDEHGLLAYVVTRSARMFGTDALLIMDMACRNGADAALKALFGARLRNAQEAGTGAAVTMGWHPFFKSLWRMGFVAVPDRFNPRPMKFVVKGHTERVNERLYDASSWCVTLADWDVF